MNFHYNCDGKSCHYNTHLLKDNSKPQHIRNHTNHNSHTSILTNQQLHFLLASVSKNSSDHINQHQTMSHLPIKYRSKIVTAKKKYNQYIWRIQRKLLWLIKLYTQFKNLEQSTSSSYNSVPDVQV